MGNNTTDNKLDETVKNTLSNYEAKFDAGDWSRMESMLNAAPKSTNFSWSTPLTIIVGIAIVSGGYLMYKNVKSSKPAAETIIEATQPTVTTISKSAVPAAEPARPAGGKITVTPPPVVAKTEIPVVAPVTKEQPVVTSAGTKEEKTIAAPPVKTTETNNTNSAALSAKEKIKKDKNTGKETQTVSVMGNEPVFGDMIDSSKGIIHETKEKEKTKKAAKSQSNTPIGFGFLNQNLDSLKRHSEQIKKDSVK